MANTIKLKYLALLLSFTLSACGGGGSGGGSDNTVPEDGVVADDSNSDTPVDGNTDTDNTDSTGSENNTVPETDLEEDIATETDPVTDPVTDAAGPIVDPGQTPEEEVNNAPPVIASFTLTPRTLMMDELVDFSWEISDVDNDTLTCAIDVDGDGTAEYSLQVCSATGTQSHIYYRPGDFEPVLTVTDTAQEIDVATTMVSVLPVLLSISAPDSVAPGNRLHYELNVSNVSLSPIDNLTVQLRVPEGLDFHPFSDVAPDTNCGSCVGGDEASWQLGTLLAGESRVISINALVLESVLNGSTLNANFRVTADVLPDAISRFKAVNVANRPLSALAVSASHDPVVAGDTVRLTVDVGNIHTSALSNLELRTSLPRGTIVNAISDGGQVDDSSGEIVWSAATLEVLSSLRRHADVTIDGAVIPGELLNFESTLTHDEGNVIDQAEEIVISVVEIPSPLQLDVSVVSDSVEAGRAVGYEFTISNNSLVPVFDALLLFRVPAGVTFHPFNDVHPNTDCGSCNEASEASWSFASLAAGESQTVSVRASLLTSLQGGSLVKAHLMMAGQGLADVTSRYKTLRVDNRPLSYLTMSSSLNPATAGESVTVGIDIGNISTASIANLELRALLPANAIVSSISNGGASDGETGEIVWSIDSLDVLSVLHREVELALSTAAIPGEVVKLRSELRHDGGKELDKASELAIRVSEGSAPMTLEVNTLNASVSAGSRLEYEVVLSNKALVPLTDIKVVLRVSDGVQFHSFNDVEPDTNCGRCAAGSEALWSFGSIAIGESRTISISMPVLPSVQSGNIIRSQFNVTASNMLSPVSTVAVTPVQ